MVQLFFAEALSRVPTALGDGDSTNGAEFTVSDKSHRGFMITPFRLAYA